jgi:copper(I)-binding protein
MQKPFLAAPLLAALVLLGSAAAHAEVTVAEPWVRATVPAQKATGAFMQLKSDVDARLVSAASPVAGVVELHEMLMDKDVMKMSPVSGLDLPAGQGVELKPGGYHVMLMDLKQQVKVGDEVPLTLTIENKDGSRATVELRAPVRALNAPMKKMHH